MLIGLSYSRCVRDIVDGTVDINNVLVLITRTDFDPHNDEQWAGIWHGYHSHDGLSHPEWSTYADEDEQKFRDVTLNLWNRGKFHQPRRFKAYPSRRPEYWLEAVLPSSELDRNPAAKGAWEQFQLIAGLTGVTVDEDYH